MIYRIRYHINRRQLQLEGKEESKAKDLETYDFDEQVEKIKEEEEKIRQRNRETKRRKRDKKAEEKKAAEAEENDEEVLAAMGFGGFK